MNEEQSSNLTQSVLQVPSLGEERATSFHLVANSVVECETEKEREKISEILNFDENKIPPTLEAGLLHQESVGFLKRIAHLSLTKDFKMCPCCGNIKGEEYSLCEDSDKLDCDGPVIPLFFQFSKFLMVMTTILSIVGFFSIVYTVSANCDPGLVPNSDPTTVYPCNYGIDTIVRIEARNQLGNYFKVSNIILLILWISGIIGFITYHRYERELKIKIKRNQVLISDYTLMVHNLEQGPETTESYLKDYLYSRIRLKKHEASEMSIATINIGDYDGNMVMIKSKIEEIQNRSACYTKKANSEGIDPIIREELLSRVAETATELAWHHRELKRAELKSQNSKSKHKNLIAFVTMRTTKDAKQIVPIKGLGWFSASVFGLFGRSKIHLTEPAREPDDIRWKNIGYSPIQRWYSHVISTSLFFVLLVLCFLLQILYFYFLKVISSDSGPSTMSRPMQFLYQCLGFLTLVIGESFNFFLVNLINYLDEFEKHISETDSLLSKTRKLIYFQFFNTALFPFILSYFRNDLSGFSSLPNYIFKSLLLNIFIGPLMAALDTASFWRRFIIQPITINKLMSHQFVSLTQKELNLLIEPADINFQLRYSSIVRTFFVACFYFEILPSGMFLCLVFLFVQYWTDKYNVLRTYKKVPRLHYLLPYGISEFAEMSIVLMLIGSFALRLKYTGTNPLTSPLDKFIWLMFIVGTIVIVSGSLRNCLAIEDIAYQDYTDHYGTLASGSTDRRQSLIDPIESEFLYEDGIREDVPYEKAWLNFDTDYERSNPITAKEASKKWREAKLKYQSSKTSSGMSARVSSFKELPTETLETSDLDQNSDLFQSRIINLKRNMYGYNHISGNQFL